ncbi:hypothetical protein A9K65_032955 (plasmid) [Mesorhizobium sp. WSM1497]|uniref:hypothetical protein n=1 Tax=unclassified Mesorhizobium TaxID=325217 RepID=UPI0004829CF6|nr:MULTISPECIES: hypothetical protein [unclassified Mesorhizobium]ARP68217.1 hypothetical protein A9K65_032955 [Mesorhizobium sp. WSM1497]
MVADDIAARRLKMLVEQYVENRKRRHDFISTSTAETAIREVLPNCPISGKALDDLIAASAIAHGLGVRFDRSASMESAR